MMKRSLVALGCLTLAACADMTPPGGLGASAPAPTPEPVAPAATPMSAKERFVAAAEANGCVVNEATSPAILAGATLSVDDLARILTELQTEGKGTVAADGQSFQVTTGACA